jgi:hypothetical protein
MMEINTRHWNNIFDMSEEAEKVFVYGHLMTTRPVFNDLIYTVVSKTHSFRRCCCCHTQTVRRRNLIENHQNEESRSERERDEKSHQQIINYCHVITSCILIYLVLLRVVAHWLVRYFFL